ncbi:MAG: hypothetical protein KIT46_07035 [Anaerolineales bacterium]|nr:hypothetical protein [Anaerolineales bacterium]MCW5855782.1 hypothetical protein [Anaerolineales bacterium]
MKAPTPSPHANSANCPECGGPQADGFSCWGLLGAVIAWEMYDADLQAEHFKIVASYNLQHPAQFHADPLADLQAAYIEQIDLGLPASQIRKRMGGAFEGERRVLKDPAERQPVLRTWKMTIADVYAHGQAEGAAQRVRQWAASLRAEL